MPTTDTSVPASTLREIPVTDIATDGSNPRTLFDQGGEAGLKELATSIKEHGLVQPVTVRPNPDGTPPFLLVAGERRLRAVRDVLKGTTIMAIVRHDLAADTAQEATVLENLQRCDLHPVEEARGLDALRRRYGYSPKKIAAAIGRREVWVKERLKLCALPVATQDLYLHSTSHRLTLEVMLDLHDLTHGGRDNAGFPAIITALAEDIEKGRIAGVQFTGLAQHHPGLVQSIQHAWSAGDGRWAGNYFDTADVCRRCPFGAYRQGYYEGVGTCLLPDHYADLLSRGKDKYDVAQAEVAASRPVGTLVPALGGWQPEPQKTASQKGKETRKRHKDQKAAYFPTVQAIERVVDLLPDTDAVDQAVALAYVLSPSHVSHTAREQVTKRHHLVSFPALESTPTASQVASLRALPIADATRYVLEALLLTQAERARDMDPGTTAPEPVLALYLKGHVDVASASAPAPQADDQEDAEATDDRDDRTGGDEEDVA